MTHEEIEKKAKDYFVNECMENGVCDHHDLAEMITFGYNKAYAELLSMEKISGWIARQDIYLNKGHLLLFSEKPERDGNYGWKGNLICALPDNEFSEVDWLESPVEVELLIRKI